MTIKQDLPCDLPTGIQNTKWNILELKQITTALLESFCIVATLVTAAVIKFAYCSGNFTKTYETNEHTLLQT